MNRILLYLGAFALSVAGLSSCADDYEEYDNSYLMDNDETMTLEASAASLELNADMLNDEVLTFTWTPARQMPDDYVLTYVTMLDLKVNEFSTSTMIRNVENDGVFSRSYTTEQLQNYITEKWARSTAEEATLSFKVIAKWDGGSKYVMPEVRTVDVDIMPYRPNVFEADKVYLDGDAVKAIRPSSNYTMPKTPENEFIYAEEYLIGAGRMTIPVEQDGVIKYICPAGGESVNVPDNDPADGIPASSESYPAKVMDLPDEGEDVLPAWNLPSEGYWRVIIDMEEETVRFYSPKNRLEPLTVQFYYEGNSDTGWLLEQTLDAGTYYVNTMTGWDNWKGKPYDFVVSKTDPQLLIWLGQGSTIDVSDKFCIKTGQSISDCTVIKEGTGRDPNGDAGMNFVSKSWAFVPEGNGDAPMVMNQWMPMMQTVSNMKWTLDDVGGSVRISKITVDLRNNRIRFD